MNLNRRFLLLTTAIGTTLAIASMSSSAVAATDAEQAQPGLIDRLFKDLEIPKSHSLDSEIEEIVKQPEVKEVQDAKKLVGVVKSVSFNGNAAIKNESLQKVVEPYLGRELTQADLAQLKYDVAKKYYDLGYVLVIVSTPPQKLDNGNLQVNVLEAKADRLTINDNGVVKKHVPESFAKRIKTGDTITDENVESVVRDINDLKNIKATVTLTPGEKYGTTDLVIHTREAKEDVQTISVDNYGSELTGEIITSLHLEKSNLLKLGETVEADFRVSDDELWSAKLGAQVPTGFYNVMAEGSILYSKNEIGDYLSYLDVEGESTVGNVALSSNVINSRKHKGTIRGGLEIREHESTSSVVDKTEDSIRRAYGEATYLYRGANYVLYTATRLSRGVDIFDASRRGDAYASRAAGNPDAWILEPLVVANARPFSPDGTFKALAFGQMASSTLLSSDLFTIGGYGSVRGFELADEAGEAGHTFSIEYNHRIPLERFNVPHSDKFSVAIGPFLDGGAVYNRIDGSTLDSHYYSTGIGLETTADIVPVGETRVRLDWAHPIGDYDNTRISDDTFYFKVSQDF